MGNRVVEGDLSTVRCLLRGEPVTTTKTGTWLSYLDGGVVIGYAQAEFDRLAAIKSERRRAVEEAESTVVVSKVCAFCRETKPIEEFPKDRYRKDGHVRICKVCLRTSRRRK